MNGWVYAGFGDTYHTMGVDSTPSTTKVTPTSWARTTCSRASSVAFSSERFGSVWMDLTDDGLDEKLLLKKDGTAVYAVQDIGTALLRFQDCPDLDRRVHLERAGIPLQGLVPRARQARSSRSRPSSATT